MQLKTGYWTDRDLLLRYNVALSNIRRSRRTIPIEKRVCYLQQHIHAYGFDFFAHHYIGDEVKELEHIAETLK